MSESHVLCRRLAQVALPWRLRPNGDAVLARLDLAALASVAECRLPMLELTIDAMEDRLRLSGRPVGEAMGGDLAGLVVLPFAVHLPTGMAPRPRWVVRLVDVVQGQPIWRLKSHDRVTDLDSELFGQLALAFTPRRGWYRPFGHRQRVVDCPFVLDRVNGRDAELALRLRLQDRADAWVASLDDGFGQPITIELDEELEWRCYPALRNRRQRQVWLTRCAVEWAAEQQRLCFGLHSGESAARWVVSEQEAKEWLSTLPFVPAVGKLAALRSRETDSPGTLLLDGRVPTDRLAARRGAEPGCLLPVLVASLPETVLQGAVVPGSWARRLTRCLIRRLRLPLAHLRVRLDEGRVVEATAHQLLDEAVQQAVRESLLGRRLPVAAEFGWGPMATRHGRTDEGWYWYRRRFDGEPTVRELCFEVRASMHGPRVDALFTIDEVRPLRDGDKLFVAGTKVTLRLFDDDRLPGPKDLQGHCCWALALDPAKLFGRHFDLTEQVVHRALLAVDPEAELPDRAVAWDASLPPEARSLDQILAAVAAQHDLRSLPSPRCGDGLLVELPVYPDHHTGATGAQAGEATLWSLPANWLVSDSGAWRRRQLARLEERDAWGQAVRLLATITQPWTVTQRDGGLWVDGPGLDAAVPAVRLEGNLDFVAANALLLALDGPHRAGCWDEHGRFTPRPRVGGLEGTVLHPDPDAWLVLCYQGGPPGEGRRLGRCLVLPPEARRCLGQPQPVTEHEGRLLYRVDRAVQWLDRLVRLGTLPAGRPSELFPGELDGSRRFDRQQLVRCETDLLGPDGRLTKALLRRVAEVFSAHSPGLRIVADAHPSVDPDTVEVDPAWLDHCLGRLADLRLAARLTEAEATERLREELPGFLLEGDLVVAYRPPVEPGHGFVGLRVVRAEPYCSRFHPEEPRARLNAFVLEHLMRGDRDGDLLYLEPCGRDERLFAELRPTRLTVVYRDLARQYASERGGNAARFAERFEFAATAGTFAPTRIDLDGVGQGLPLRALPERLALPDGALLEKAAEQAAGAVALKVMATLRRDEYRDLASAAPDERADLAAFYRLVGEAGIDKHREGGVSAAWLVDRLHGYGAELTAGQLHQVEQQLRRLVDATPAIAWLEAYRARRALARGCRPSPDGPLSQLFGLRRGDPTTALLETIGQVGPQAWVDQLRQQLLDLVSEEEPAPGIGVGPD